MRSYVLGYYKSERNEVTGTTKPVALRDGTKYSVILGVFGNEGYGATVTIAQVFWLRGADVGGQPDRFYVTADKPLSVAGDFADFGSEITALRRRLRADGAQIYDSFPEYGKEFRRRLGIESEQAMELFHQTVSMKSVGNLTDFVRDHMLEPFDAAKWTAGIVAHFEDLTRAHEAVQRAQAQLTALGPLLAECDAHDKVAAEITALTAQRTALRYYFADLKAGLVDRLLADLSTERTGLHAQLTDLATRLKDLRSTERALDIELAGHGGNRLAEIDRLLRDNEAACRDRMEKAERFGKLLAEAGLDQVETAEHFAVRRSQIAAAREAAKQDLADAQNRLTDAGYAAKALGRQGGRGQRRADQPARAPEQHPQAPAGPAGLDVPGAAAGRAGAAVRRGADGGSSRRRPTGKARPNGCCAASRCPCSSPSSTTPRYQTGSTVTT